MLSSSKLCISDSPLPLLCVMNGGRVLSSQSIRELMDGTAVSSSGTSMSEWISESTCSPNTASGSSEEGGDDDDDGDDDSDEADSSGSRKISSFLPVRRTALGWSFGRALNPASVYLSGYRFRNRSLKSMAFLLCRSRLASFRIRLQTGPYAR